MRDLEIDPRVSSKSNTGKSNEMTSLGFQQVTSKERLMTIRSKFRKKMTKQLTLLQLKSKSQWTFLRTDVETFALTLDWAAQIEHWPYADRTFARYSLSPKSVAMSAWSLSRLTTSRNNFSLLIGWIGRKLRFLRSPLYRNTKNLPSHQSTILCGGSVYHNIPAGILNSEWVISSLAPLDLHS